jgi:hypothetical protein
MLGRKRRDDDILAVEDFTHIWASLIAPIKDGLQVNRHRGVVRQERNSNRWQAILELDRINQERSEFINSVDRDVVIKGTARINGRFQGHCCRVLAPTQ